MESLTPKWDAGCGQTRVGPCARATGGVTGCYARQILIQCCVDGGTACGAQAGGGAGQRGAHRPEAEAECPRSQVIELSPIRPPLLMRSS